MDGLFHGKAYEQMGWFGGKHPYFWFNTHMNWKQLKHPDCRRVIASELVRNIIHVYVAASSKGFFKIQWRYILYPYFVLKNNQPHLD